jgi:RNA polymerase sigma-70 factor (ECF subfamily)
MPRHDHRLLDEIEQVYRTRYQAFARLAFGITGNPEVAAEAVQQAFADVIRGRGGFRGEAPLEAWIWRAVVNAAQKANRRKLTLVPEQPADAPFEAPPPEDVARLAPHIATLPERQRVAVFLRYYADLDYRAIAQVLGVKVGTVSATLAAAHATLRQSIEEVNAHG